MMYIKSDMKLMRKLKKPYSIIAKVLFVLVLLFSCIILYDLDTFIFNGPPGPWFKPSNDYISGSWRVPSSVAEYLISDGHNILPHYILLKEDGTFSIHDCPYLWYIDYEPLVTGEGIWEVNWMPSYGWYVSLEFGELNVDIENNMGTLHIKGRYPPYTLYAFKREFRILPFEKD